MLSFTSAAYMRRNVLISTFSANLETLLGAVGHPEIMAQWETRPEAWQAARTNLQSPAQAMSEYLAWLQSLLGKPVFVGYPAGFEHQVIDIRTYAVATLKRSYQESSRGYAQKVV